MGSVGPIAGDRLRAFVERVERIHEERDALGGDLKEIYAEAKGTGFCTKTLKKVVQARRMDKADREEQDALFETYMRAIEGGSGPTRSAGTVSANKPRARAGAPAGAREAAAQSAVKVFVDSVANRPGESVSITTPDGRGVKIENSDGKKLVSAVDRNSVEYQPSATGGVGEGGETPALPDAAVAAPDDSAQRQGRDEGGRKPAPVSDVATSAEPPAGGSDLTRHGREEPPPAVRGSDSKKDGEDLLDIPACLRPTTGDKPRAASLFEQVTGVRVQRRPVVTKAADGREELQPFG